MRFKFIFKIVSALVLLVVVGFACYQVGFNNGEQKVLKTPPAVVNEGLGVSDKADFSVFWEAWRKLEENFIDKNQINYSKMVYGAVEGMVKSLGDPYTTFFTPSQTKSFNEELEGAYDGVGMVVGIKGEQLVVISPFKGTPADLAGLKAGDEILKINDTQTKDITIEEAVKTIKGKPGTTVKLLVQQKDAKEPKEFIVARQKIIIPTLEKEIKDNDIVYLKIYQFNKILLSEFDRAAGEVLRSNQKKIIIDIRDNPGGFLEVAQIVAGWFLKEGDLVVSQDEGKDKPKRNYKSMGPGVFASYPTVVLINEGSASASEILAGALRDQRGVKLIGQKSFGKGSVQEQIDLFDNSSLKITVAKWYTPKGVCIDKNGLVPDIVVDNPATSTNDIQLDKAIEALRAMNNE